MRNEKCWNEEKRKTDYCGFPTCLGCCLYLLLFSCFGLLKHRGNWGGYRCSNGISMIFSLLKEDDIMIQKEVEVGFFSFLVIYSPGGKKGSNVWSNAIYICPCGKKQSGLTGAGSLVDSD